MIDDYFAALVGRLGDRLLGAYAVGSLALGGYRPGRSDIDVLALVAEPLSHEERLAVASACSHRALPCPGRKLELVVMTGAEAAAPSARPRWELNLNSGPGMEDHVGMDPFAEPAFWFVLDLALARSHGVTLAGPHARELVGESRPEVVLAAHADAVGWYARNEPGEEAVAAACRAWLWEETGRFAAKADAVAWAAARIAQRDGSR